MDWTVRVVSTLLIGPQGEEKNLIFGAYTSMAPTSAGTIVKGVIKLCASALIFTIRAHKTLSNSLVMTLYSMLKTNIIPLFNV